MFKVILIGIFLVAVLVVLLGHFHMASVYRSRLTSAIHFHGPASTPAPPLVPTRKPLRPAPVLLGLPDDQIDKAPNLTQDAKEVLWLPDVVHRDRGRVLSDSGDRVGWQVISHQSPRALRVFNTLPPEDCRALIDYAKTFMARSQVIAAKFNGQSEVNQVRTSTGMFMATAEQRNHPVNRRLHANARAVIGLPDDTWLEATQILHYEPGQFYRPHTDYFDAGDAPNMNRGGQRTMTILTWLTDVDEGGETTFPYARPQPIAADPSLGQSVLFYDVDRNGAPDVASTHGGNPPKPGSEKWVAVIWCHLRTFV